MTALNKQALREAAQEEIMLRSASDTSDAWQDEASPEAVLALLDELEAAEKRIAELDASHSKQREGMAAIYNAICENGASTSLSAILTFVKRSREESASAAGIGVKGE
ncbi:ead/Ea22-like family protein [Salmonella enterica]|nr:ead/Ea22-like family protein [Salmonella enterica]EJJ9938992.1 ead/Ea22-like family protein [Salmonella enterica]EJQ4623965.1 ead/Ea22-like family protein [Salmonella enterica]